MRRTFELAALSVGEASPNPMVGCVIAAGGRIVGEGFHRRPGLPHAEVEALAAAGGEAKGADLYVNLEPCCHFGRTPPCTQAIVAAGIGRVVAATVDPNPKVAGGGFRALREAGVEVAVGLLEDEARALNEAYFHLMQTGRPFVTLKWAMSLDGKVAAPEGATTYLSGEAALKRVHEMRRQADAVLVGIGTVLRDDPSLTVRHVEGRSPLRIVVDGRLETPPTARVLSPGVATLILTTEDADPAREEALLRAGAEVSRLAGRGRVDIGGALAHLGRRGVASLLVEGGPRLHGSFMDEGYADRIMVDVAARVIGARDALSAVLGDGARESRLAKEFEMTRVEWVAGDVLVEARPKGDGTPHVHRDRTDTGNALRAKVDADRR